MDGCILGYLGLLIASGKYYPAKSYAFMQFLTIIAGIGALFIGSVFGITELQRIGGTFFVLYIIEKVMWDIPKKSLLAYALWGMIVSGALYAGALFIKSHPEEVGKYFLAF